jgi:hypothetical protein
MAVVDKLQPRQVSEPVQLLEGVAILRLDDRAVPVQRSFDQVKVRAAELWQREEAERAGRSSSPSCARATRSASTRASMRRCVPSTDRPRAS